MIDSYLLIYGRYYWLCLIRTSFYDICHNIIVMSNTEKIFDVDVSSVTKVCAWTEQNTTKCLVFTTKSLGHYTVFNCWIICIIFCFMVFFKKTKQLFYNVSSTFVMFFSILKKRSSQPAKCNKLLTLSSILNSPSQQMV